MKNKPMMKMHDNKFDNLSLIEYFDELGLNELANEIRENQTQFTDFDVDWFTFVVHYGEDYTVEYTARWYPNVVEVWGLIINNASSITNSPALFYTAEQ